MMKSSALALLLAVVFGTMVRAEPQLERITVATVPTTSLRSFERRYARWLGYELRERGRVSQALAESWGAPKTAGRRYILMSPDGARDVYIRAVESPRIRGYEPMTTWGWNGIEIIVDDPPALREQIDGSPFEIIGEPKPLTGYPTIVAFQVVGPDQEVLYLTAETGDRETSTLPLPNGDVGRVFIMVLAGPDIDYHLDWYAQTFGMSYGPVYPIPIGVIQRAQGIAADELIGLGLIRLNQHGNLIEFDGYSSAHSSARPHEPGELMPGIAITSFEVADLDSIEAPSIRAPESYDGEAYSGRRSMSVRGPFGELVELIEVDRGPAP